MHSKLRFVLAAFSVSLISVAALLLLTACEHPSPMSGEVILSPEGSHPLNTLLSIQYTGGSFVEEIRWYRNGMRIKQTELDANTVSLAAKRSEGQISSEGSAAFPARARGRLTTRYMANIPGSYAVTIYGAFARKIKSNEVEVLEEISASSQSAESSNSGSAESTDSASSVSNASSVSSASSVSNASSVSSASSVNSASSVSSASGSSDGSSSSTPPFIEMVQIPPTGNAAPFVFQMGSPSDEPGRSSDETQYMVTLTRSFLMSKYEVTQEQYLAVMGSNPSYFKSGADGTEVQEKRPVETVTWYEAVEFCNALSETHDLTPVYTIDKDTQDPNNKSTSDTLKWTVTWNPSANGYRLPTEAEWEYACRAGTVTAFHCGTTGYTSTSDYDAILEPLGWYTLNSGSKTHQVGQKAANDWGLYDMHGNVWEWCWDWYGTYSGDGTDPLGAAAGAYRAIRGGAYSDTAEYARSACRDYGNPSSRSNYGGFRLVRLVP